MKNDSREFPIGSTVLNTYRIDDCFRSGGMGLVYRAAHLNWDIDLAIKHPRKKLIEDPAAVRAFQRECDLWERIGLHPYIVTLFYLREIESMPCVVSEFVEGGSLADAIRTRSLYTGDDDTIVSRILTFAAQMAWGLDKAASVGLIHCDFKPGNVLLTEHGTAKVNDFGLAALHTGSERVKAGGYTPLYTSPEQLRGDELDATTDIWSWAATVFEMFTGEAIWGRGSAVGSAHEQFRAEGGKAPGCPRMPESVSHLLESCLRSDPRLRRQSFQGIAEEIQTIHKSLFDEPCDADRFDDEIVAADSMNNRAVSRFDLGDPNTALGLLQGALVIDPLHPEANFNLALLSDPQGVVREECLTRLSESWNFDQRSIRAALFSACLLRLSGDQNGARQFEDIARANCDETELSFMEHLLGVAVNGKMVPLLARPMSGEDFFEDLKRFNRLMEKGQKAFELGDLDEARRLLVLSGDIDGLNRHPKRRLLLAKCQQ